MVDGEIDPQQQELQVKQFASDIAQYAGTVVAIEDDVTDGAWAEFYAGIHEKKKEIEDWFDQVKKPINEALKRLNTKQHELCDPLKAVEDAITKARGDWYWIKKQRQDEENKKSLADSAGTGGVAIIQPKPTQSVITSGGTTVGLRKQPSWRLTDDPTITARVIDDKKMKFTRAEPTLKNVPDTAFYLMASAVAALIKTGQMPEGVHSIEKFDEMVSTSK